MKKYFLAALVLLLAAAAVRGAEARRLARERIVLRTVAGDIVIALYPDVAPRHVEQVLQLTRLGVYDTCDFCRVHPGFVSQLSAYHGRRVPLTPEQRAGIQPIPGEFSDTLKHRRGTVSMARDDNPDSAETSFSILLGDAPHLDGKYTIFGHVESGMAVLNEFVKVPTEPARAGATPNYRPLVRLEVLRAEVAASREALTSMDLAPARPVPISEEEIAARLAESQPPPNPFTDPGAADEMLLTVNGMLVMALLLIVGTGLASYFLSKVLSPGKLLCLQLVTVLIGSFMLFAVLTPVGHANSTFATGLFFATVGLLRLMGRFESAD